MTWPMSGVSQPFSLARFGLAGQILAFCVIWSSAFAVGKIGLAHMPPLLFLAVRFLLAGAVMVGAAAVTGGLRGLGRRDVLVLAGLGLLNNALYLGLSFSGMATVSAGLTSVIISANPVLTALAAAAVLGEPLTARKGVGLVLGMAGVVVILRHRLTTGAEDAAGLVQVLAALVSLVLGTVLFKKLAPKAGLLAGNGIQAGASGLALLPAALLLEEVGRAAVTPALLGSLAYMVFVVSIGGYLLWFHLLRRGTATQASAYHFLMPPLGLLFGWALLGEAVWWADFVGIVPVAVGIALVTWTGPAPAPVQSACALRRAL